MSKYSVNMQQICRWRASKGDQRDNDTFNAGISATIAAQAMQSVNDTFTTDEPQAAVLLRVQNNMDQSAEQMLEYLDQIVLEMHTQG